MAPASRPAWRPAAECECLSSESNPRGGSQFGTVVEAMGPARAQLLRTAGPDRETDPVLHYTIGQTMGQAPGLPERVESCAVCGENHPFELPEELVASALDGKLVVFVGAGISTESRRVDRNTFAERIAAELGRKSLAPTFPEIMTEYEDKFGRAKLLQRIRQRFDRIKEFPEVWRMATRFHHALATAYFLNQIITTNWDTYFEDITEATPIVLPADYAFSELEGRKVFKLHGSMHNLGTVVATQRDYDRCYRRLRVGVIGATLKHLLATRPAVFIGYSFGDPDLNRILRFLRKELADVLPRSYLVTPHGYEGTDFPPERVLVTDGTYFIHKLKDAAVEQGRMRPDRVFARTQNLLVKIVEAHDRVFSSFNVKDTPAVIYALAYQDGVLHAFERIMAMLPSGFYSNPHSTYHVVPAYELVVKGAIRERSYWDAAYAAGYRNGMMSLDLDDAAADLLPLYLVWGAKRDLRDFDDFTRDVNQARQLHKAATTYAIRLVRNMPDGVEPHHSAFLNTERYLAAAARVHASSKSEADEGTAVRPPSTAT
jgi:SIR2-like domain